MKILMNSCIFNAKQSTKFLTRGRFGQFGKKVSCHRKDLKFSLFIVNSSAAAIWLFSSSFKSEFELYSNLKPRRVNRNVN